MDVLKRRDAACLEIEMGGVSFRRGTEELAMVFAVVFEGLLR